MTDILTNPNLNNYVIQFETEDMTDDAVMPKYKSTIGPDEEQYIIWLSKLDDYTTPGVSYFKKIKTKTTTDNSLQITQPTDNDTCKIPNILHDFIIKALKLLDEYKTIGYKNNPDNKLFQIITPPQDNIEETRVETTNMNTKSNTKIDDYTKYWGQAVGVEKKTNDTNTKIGNNVFLIMSYNSKTINFGYTWTKHKQIKQSRMTSNIENIINTKLDKTSYNNSVQNIFNNKTSVSSKYYISDTNNKSKNNNNNHDAYIEIYTTETEIIDLTFNKLEYNKLKQKPHTLLKHDIGSTFINILISILDKPHDIIGSRVNSAAQKNIMNEIIIPNLNKYIDYMTVIKEHYLKETDNKNKTLTTFINFVNIMLNSFKNTSPSKTFTSELSYENAILYLVCKYHNQDVFKQSGFNLTFNTIDNTGIIYDEDKDKIIINPDIMNLTTEIKTVLNATDNGAREYFSTPEVIDHGHVYPIINENTRIEFPENYKEIQLPIIDIDKPHPQPVDIYFVIHSYSTTDKRVDDEYKLNYIVYVWFTIMTITTTPLVESDAICVIKYTVPFRNAPDCAKVYEGFNNIIKSKLSTITNTITTAINNKSILNKYGEKMKNILTSIMLDQFFNSKSLQDDQNQLQVNQLSTLLPIDNSIKSSDTPTTFIGLCTDLASAANGINYYFSRTLSTRNNNSIVAYYSKLKKNAKCIWAQSDTIYFFSQKSININIATRILDIIMKKTEAPKNLSTKKKGGVSRLTRKKQSKRLNNNPSIRHRTLRLLKVRTQLYTSRNKSNRKNQLLQNRSDNNQITNDNTTDNYQITNYNTMYDIFYMGVNKSRYFDFDLLFKEYNGGHFLFAIYSNHFIETFLDKLQQYKLVNDDTHYIIANELLSDDTNNSKPFYSNNLYGEDRSINGQIELSEKLFKIYENICNTNSNPTNTIKTKSDPIHMSDDNDSNKNHKRPHESANQDEINKMFKRPNINQSSMVLSSAKVDMRKTPVAAAGYKK